MLLLLLPIVYLLLPLPFSTPEPSSLFIPLRHLQNSVRLSSLTHAAVGRDERLRSEWIRAGEDAEHRLDAARTSVAVRREMEAFRIDTRQLDFAAERWLAEAGWTYGTG